MAILSIFDIPPELMEEILLFCDPVDVASFAQTCSCFRQLVYAPADNHLWRRLYLLQPLDDPRTCVSHTGKPKLEEQATIDWKRELQRVIQARNIVNDIVTRYPCEEIPILKTFLDLVCYTPALPHPRSHQVSQNLIWVAEVLRKGLFIFNNDLHGPSHEGRQLRARLHLYFGLTSTELFRPAQRVASRSIVYSMRNYRRENDFGPFMMDGSGRVNWEHMKAIHHVVSMHVMGLSEDDVERFPMSLAFTQLVDKEEEQEQEQEMNDWVGVTGTWHCAFCFCDHRELLVYNNLGIPEGTPLDTSIFAQPDFNEVFRSMDVELRIRSTEFDANHPKFPKIYFSGEMGDHSVMSGWIALTPDEQVRWHFVSGDQGMSIWSSEGIQVGGLRSKFGILGTWTTVFHDLDDPVGPFWLRKANDDD